MRPFNEAKARWEETLRQSSSLADLQRAVKFNGSGSPCVAGCRSVCWKAFLLFQNADAADWSHVLLEARSTYSGLREQYLKYIKHPQLLAELPLDPLADDPDSPWNTVRQDEAVRAEILQDVQRLPDEPLYRQEAVQVMILDILFIYCKLNPDAGGYRQGMHELLAPLVYVVHQDAVGRDGVAPDDLADPNMVELLDAYYVEHDAFALFCKIMAKAKTFYAVGPAAPAPAAEQSAIVEKSRRIHEAVLVRIDPELASHLKSIEILPQIFLIRWIRLLFGREFPFDQLLVLWDTIFAFDPAFTLIDLICVAMLIRIRWALLEADYSNALQLLLKYPAPQAPHGPHTFVDDAVYLRDHYNTLGGASLIIKYTGRTPSAPPGSGSGSSRPVTPNLQGLSLRGRGGGGGGGGGTAQSPLASPARFLNQPPHGVEALFQGAAGAAKGVIERGERLGINQAVRDAMGEIRRNMQGFQEARRAAGLREAAGASPLSPGRGAAGELERRNRQLATVLDEAVAGLQALAAAPAPAPGEGGEGGAQQQQQQQQREALEAAVARVRFVKVHLEDSSLALTDVEAAGDRPGTAGSGAAPAEDEVMSGTEAGPSPSSSSAAAAGAPPAAQQDPLQTGAAATAATAALSPASSASSARPAPIPTRSTLAQSSFSWMLEPDETAPPPSPPGGAPARGPGGGPGRRPRQRSSASRERNAFLFGEVKPAAAGAEGAARRGSGTAGGGAGARPFTSDDIFGLEPLRKPPRQKQRGKSLEGLFGEVLSE